MENAMRSIKPDNRIRAGYTAAFCLLLLSYLITLYANRQILNQSKLVEHTYKVMSSLDNLLAPVIDAETGLRGYLITKKQTFLEPYKGSFQRMDSVHNSLVQLTHDNPVLQYRLTNMRKMIDRRFEIIEFSLREFDSKNHIITDTIGVLQEEAKTIMDNLRETIKQSQQFETNLLAQRDSQLRQTFAALNTIIIVSLVIAFSLVAFGFVTYVRENKARNAAVKKIRDFQDELKNRVNELNKANLELIQMRRLEKFTATGRIARTIAHEVRNPLTNISLAADQLKGEAYNNSEEVSELFEMINRNALRINHLISDLLHSTKFVELKYEGISINSLMDETLDMARDRIDLKNVKVIKNYSDSVCDVMVDKEKLKIAFLNIIVNAIESMELTNDLKILTIETRGEDNKCKVVISDTGEGMDKEAESRLFEPYFTTKPKGNGLGLANTQNIILNHKGDITVTSERGKGTTFVITLDFAPVNKD